MKVVLAGFGMEPLTRTAADLEALGAETLIVQTDVSEAEQVEKPGSSHDRSLRPGRPAGETTPGSPQPGKTLELTLGRLALGNGGQFLRSAPWPACVSSPRMIERKQPSHVVNVSSLSGVLPAGGSYGVSKHAVLVLAESLYRELAESAPHVKVSVLCPGWVATEFYRVDQSRPERFQRGDDRGHRRVPGGLGVGG